MATFIPRKDFWTFSYDESSSGSDTTGQRQQHLQLIVSGKNISQLVRISSSTGVLRTIDSRKDVKSIHVYNGDVISLLWYANQLQDAANGNNNGHQMSSSKLDTLVQFRLVWVKDKDIEEDAARKNSADEKKDTKSDGIVDEEKKEEDELADDREAYVSDAKSNASSRALVDNKVSVCILMDDDYKAVMGLENTDGNRNNRNDATVAETKESRDDTDSKKVEAKQPISSGLLRRDEQKISCMMHNIDTAKVIGWAAESSTIQTAEQDTIKVVMAKEEKKQHATCPDDDEKDGAAAQGANGHSSSSSSSSDEEDLWNAGGFLKAPKEEKVARGNYFRDLRQKYAADECAAGKKVPAPFVQRSAADASIANVKSSSKDEYESSAPLTMPDGFAAMSYSKSYSYDSLDKSSSQHPENTERNNTPSTPQENGNESSSKKRTYNDMRSTDQKKEVVTKTPKKSNVTSVDNSGSPSALVSSLPHEELVQLHKQTILQQQRNASNNPSLRHTVLSLTLALTSNASAYDSNFIKECNDAATEATNGNGAGGMRDSDTTEAFLQSAKHSGIKQQQQWMPRLLLGTKITLLQGEEKGSEL